MHLVPDALRGAAVAFEILVVGAALRLGWIGYSRREWSDVVRSIALALFAFSAAVLTKQRLREPGVSWPVVIDLVASILAIVGFLAAEVNRRRRRDKI